MDVIYQSIDGIMKLYVEKQTDGIWAVYAEGYNEKNLIGNKTYDLKTSAEMALVGFCQNKGFCLVRGRKRIGQIEELIKYKKEAEKTNLLTLKTLHLGRVVDLILFYLDEIKFELVENNEVTVFCFIKKELISVFELHIQDIISAKPEIDTSLNPISIMESFVITKKIS